MFVRLATQPQIAVRAIWATKTTCSETSLIVEAASTATIRWVVLFRVCHAQLDASVVLQRPHAIHVRLDSQIRLFVRLATSDSWLQTARI